MSRPTLAQIWHEAHRLHLMRGLETMLHDCGHGLIAGVDEVGRGSLAGPVVAAAVVVDPNRVVPGVDDSKALRPATRQQLCAAIRHAHPRSAVATVSAREIDRVNILEATRRAMVEALAALKPRPDLALVDAVALPAAPCRTLPVVRGDQISYAIACASILAKEARDALMVRLDRRYPHYGFAEHKGYGSAAHRQALAEHGPCPVHRLTFRSVLPKQGAPRARHRAAQGAPRARQRASGVQGRVC